MEYIFETKTEEGLKSEVVEMERWQWGVVYKDKSELHQFGNDGKFHQVREINHDTVKMFSVYKTDDMNKRIDLVCSEEVQYFYFYKNYRLNIGTDGEKFIRVFVFGYKNKENGSTSYNYILSDDRVVTSDSEVKNLLEFNP